VLRFRYDLTPYNYTLAYEQAVNGKPLMRPMFYAHSSDSNAYKAEQQYMWGDALLVAPVIEKGAVTKTIYFPEGKWYDWMRNKSYAGGRWITDSVALDEIAVFAKEGSFVPAVWGFSNLDDYHTKDLQVVYFPSAKATTYTMYDDDGLTNKSWEKNAFELIQFSGQQLAASTQISISSNGGSFKGQPATRHLRLYVADLAKKPQSVQVNGQAYKLQVYTKGKKTLLQKGYAVYYPATRMLIIVTDFVTKSALKITVR
jgi:oligosaccharide 4-alpha-D-glucosyltransferase